MNLRKYAQGQPCMIRLPGICNHDPDTTVLAHLRMIGVTGAGQKAPDLLAAWACAACHDEIDRRTHHVPYDAARIAHLEGIVRTQAKLIADGVI